MFNAESSAFARVRFSAERGRQADKAADEAPEEVSAVGKPVLSNGEDNGAGSMETCVKQCLVEGDSAAQAGEEQAKQMERG